MHNTPPRKGATRASDIPAEVLQALSRGTLPTATLAEGLALDQGLLLRTVFPELPPAALRAADAVCQKGIAQRMAGLGALLWQELGPAGLARCQAHGADTVRGWA